MDNKWSYLRASPDCVESAHGIAIGDEVRIFVQADEPGGPTSGHRMRGRNLHGTVQAILKRGVKTPPHEIYIVESPMTGETASYWLSRADILTVAELKAIYGETI